jgi:hypothetical protein
LQTI